MFQRHTFEDVDQFWSTLARALEVVKVKDPAKDMYDIEAVDDKSSNEREIVVANTQHIVYFTSVDSSTAKESYLVFQGHRTVEEVDWEVDFLSELEAPFIMEIVVKMKEPVNRRYKYRTEPKYFFDLFMKHCFFANFRGREDGKDNTRTPSVFTLLIDGLLYDREKDEVIIKQLELAKLDEFAKEHISDQQTRAIKMAFLESETEQALRDTVSNSLETGLTRSLTSDDVRLKLRSATKKKRGVMVGDGGTANGLPYTNVQPESSAGGAANTEELAGGSEATVILDPVDVLFDMVKQALLVKPDKRSRYTREAMASWLCKHTKLAPCLAWAADHDVLHLTDACSLTQPPGEGSTAGKEVIAHAGEPINTLYIVVHGTINHVLSSKISVARRPGDILGGSVLSGIYQWEESIELKRGDDVALCAVSSEAVLRFVGQDGAGVLAERYMVSFWKYTQLWGIVMKEKAAAQKADAITNEIKSMFRGRDSTAEEKETLVHRNAQQGHEFVKAPDQPRPSRVTAHSSSNSTGHHRRSTMHGQGDRNGHDHSDEHHNKHDHEHAQDHIYSHDRNPRKHYAFQSSSIVDSSLSAARCNITQCARIRTCNSGSEVFKQGDPRHYLYLVLQGEGSFLRKLTEKYPLAASPHGSRSNSPQRRSEKSERRSESSKRRSASTRPKSPLPGTGHDGHAGAQTMAASQSHLKESLSSEEQVAAAAAAAPHSEDSGGETPAAHMHEAATAVKSDKSVQLSIVVENEMQQQSVKDKSTLREGGADRAESGLHQQIPEELELGLRLFGGDFSFMDGEGLDWVQRLEELHTAAAEEEEEAHGAASAAAAAASSTPSSASSSAHQSALDQERRAALKRRNKAPPFGTHKHTLFAVTRMEVCAVPLREIAKCRQAFSALLGLVFKKYAALALSDKHLAQLFVEEKIWNRQRKFVLNDIFSKRPPSAARQALRSELPKKLAPSATSPGRNRQFSPPRKFRGQDRDKDEREVKVEGREKCVQSPQTGCKSSSRSVKASSFQRRLSSVDNVPPIAIQKQYQDHAPAESRHSKHDRYGSGYGGIRPQHRRPVSAGPTGSSGSRFKRPTHADAQGVGAQGVDEARPGRGGGDGGGSAPAAAAAAAAAVIATNGAVSGMQEAGVLHEDKVGIIQQRRPSSAGGSRPNTGRIRPKDGR